MRSRLFALATVVAITTSSLTASATPDTGGQAGQDEGRTRFLRGIELYKEGNYHAALAEFRAANAAAPSSRIQYNLGQTLFQLQDYAGALSAFEAYESEGRDKIPEDRLREVDADIVKLRQRVATLRLAVPNAPLSGITITIDDESQSIGPDRTIRVSAGRRKVGVTASGFQTETRVVDVAGSSNVELRFELKPIAQAGEAKPAGAVDAYAPAEGSHKSRTPLYVGLGATAALTATAVTFTVLAASKHGKYNDAANQPNPDRSNLADLRSSTKTLALAADIFGGVAILAGKGLDSAAVSITCGLAYACARLADGAVACWGANDKAQLGTGAAGAASSNAPQRVAGVAGAAFVTAGSNHTCVLAGGSATCWGDNSAGQIKPSAGAILGPTELASATFAPIAVSGGFSHTCAMNAARQVMCIGDNTSGQLGGGTFSL